MTTSILFFFEDFVNNIYSGAYEGDTTIWHDLAKSYGCDEMIMIDLSTKKIGQNYLKEYNDLGMKFNYYTSLEEAKLQNINKHWICLEQEETLTKSGKQFYKLKDFTHPKENKIYCVGPDSGTGITLDLPINSWVCIPTPTRASLWSIIAMGIALNDNYEKLK